MPRDERHKATPLGFVQRHSLSIVLVVILIAQSVVFWYLGKRMFVAEETAHGVENPQAADFRVWYWGQMTVSILADTYGAILLVVLTKRLREVGSSEDKGS